MRIRQLIKFFILFQRYQFYRTIRFHVQYEKQRKFARVLAAQRMAQYCALRAYEAPRPPLSVLSWVCTVHKSMRLCIRRRADLKVAAAISQYKPLFCILT